MPRASTETDKRSDMEEELGFPLTNLSQAIDALKGACSKLQVSVKGINCDLEETNRRLVSAVDMHTETTVFLESVLASIPSGVVVVDTRGRILVFNEAAEVITGFTWDEVKGRHYSEVLGRGVAKKSTPIYTLATGCPIEMEEKTLPARTGESIPVGYSTSLIMDTNDHMTGALEVFTDLRRMKLLESEVSRVKTLATIGEVAAVVAHEVRNPLGGIKGFASILERDLSDNPESLALVKKIGEGIDALERIVNDLLETGRQTDLRLEHVDLNREIIRVVEIFRMAAKGEGKEIRFEIIPGEKRVHCRIDRDRIRQALTNLLRNASEAVGQSGTVTVRSYVRSHKMRSNTRSGKRSLRDYVCIDVSDTGPGIPEDVLDKVFSPFFTTKADGTGLGLPTVRRMAALHGGQVKYTQTRSGGSRFTIEIPRG
jgi:PAS domain S-box-containing protein